MSYESENKDLLNTVLETTFFEDFKNHGVEGKLFGSLEIQLTAACNLKCTYCYYSNVSGHGKKLNAGASWEELNENTAILFRWLKKNDYIPDKIDIFSGDALIYKQSYSIIRQAIDFYIDMGVKDGLVLIPSNMGFVRDPDLLAAVEELLDYARENDVYVGISASIDGKFADKITRPPVKNVDIDEYYSDDFYDKVFTFAKKHRCGFHPMVSHENVAGWIENFDWFQTMLEKHNIGWNNIYMLEVRNDGWDEKSVEAYGKLLRHALDFTFNFIKDPTTYVRRFILKGKPGENITNMNLFNNWSIIGRGIGCSLQTTLFVKLSDLTCNSCHRLSYDALNGFKFVVKDGEIVDIDPLNLSFYLATISVDVKALPYCENCLIKAMCSGGCLGAQLEATGDAFTPIPSVCLLEHGKVKTQVEFLKDHNLYDMLLPLLSTSTKTTLDQIERITE